MPARPQRATRDEESGFVALPRAVLFRRDLSEAAKVVYAALLSYARADGQCYPSQGRLANDLGMGESTVRKHLAELREKGLIETKRQGRGRPNLYGIVAVGAGPMTAQKRAVNGEVGQDMTAQKRAVNGEVGQDMTAQKRAVQTARIRAEDVEAFDVLGSLERKQKSSSERGSGGHGEEETAHIEDGAQEALVKIGMTADEARAWTAVHPEAVILEACELTRARCLLNPPRYCERVLRNWTVIESPGSRRRAERQRSARALEALAETRAEAGAEWNRLKREWDALPMDQRAELVVQAKRQAPLLRDRPADHPAVLGLALGLLRQRQAAQAGGG